MMEIFWWCVIALLLCFGFLGCFINKVPGPFAVLLATVLAKVGLDIDAVTWGTVGIVAALVVLSIVASKVLVKMLKSMQEYSKKATVGTTIGSIIGLLLLVGTSGMDNTVAIIAILVVGLLVLPFVLAFLLELTNKQGAAMAAKCAGSATAVYVADTFLKVLVFGYAVYAMFMA